MNNDEAKFLLGARRPDGTGDGVSPMREALEQASRDPELSQWLAQQQRFDGTVVRALREVKAPADLRASILAGAQAGRAGHRQMVWWRRAPVLALAASIAVASALGIGLMLRSSGHPDTVERFATHKVANVEILRAFAVADSLSGHETVVHASDLGEVGRWFETDGQPLSKGIPVDIAKLRELGCRTLVVSGREVVELCLFRGQYYHLFIARRSGFDPKFLEPAGSPRVDSNNGLAIASWVQGDLVYVLTGAGDTARISELL